ncbi:MAG: gliding motility protein GldC [Pseudopedobacter saltans]|uniref:Gliding motility protein GldC n=1 Tax=Pseudopedobacter saltans TaxID=151895 RepID=A0A2W5GKH0_9SPHI|nr:MAG: gliding motility protein GldC [Pseudopedobacter saltans]
MHKSTISIDVVLDEKKVPDSISWKASDSSADDAQAAKAMMVAFWDSGDKSALRIDLWTKDMMVDEMGDFFYQTLSSMASTFQRATQYADMAEDLKNFAKSFNEKFRAKQIEENKAN